MHLVKPSAYQRATGIRPYPLFEAIHAHELPSVLIPGVGRRIVTHSPPDSGRGSLRRRKEKGPAVVTPPGPMIRTEACNRSGPRRNPQTPLGDCSVELYTQA